MLGRERKRERESCQLGYHSDTRVDPLVFCLDEDTWHALDKMFVILVNISIHNGSFLYMMFTNP